MSERFKLIDLVDLGAGVARFAEPGEELYRFVLLALNRRLLWMTEQRLLAEAGSGTLSCWGPGDVAIETMVVPGPAPAQRDRLRALVRELIVAASWVGGAATDELLERARRELGEEAAP